MSHRVWNANIHYDALLDAAVPPGARRVLDVGTGDGFLAARLARRGVAEVVGLDVDAPVLERARHRWDPLPVEWVHGDLMTHPFEASSFDAVVSNAALHHFPSTRDALLRCAELVRPGGVVAIVGFARNATLGDWVRSLAGQAVLLIANTARRKWEHSAPQHWPPALTWAEVRETSAEVLPGCAFRRLLYGRYALTWVRPRIANTS